jgi:hypothetical protein
LVTVWFTVHTPAVQMAVGRGGGGGQVVPPVVVVLEVAVVVEAAMKISLPTCCINLKEGRRTGCQASPRNKLGWHL